MLLKNQNSSSKIPILVKTRNIWSKISVSHKIRNFSQKKKKKLSKFGQNLRFLTENTNFVENYL